MGSQKSSAKNQATDGLSWFHQNEARVDVVLTATMKEALRATTTFLKYMSLIFTLICPLHFTSMLLEALVTIGIYFSHQTCGSLAPLFNHFPPFKGSFHPKNTSPQPAPKVPKDASVGRSGPS